MSTATLNWVNPTTRVDGASLAPSDIAFVDVFDDDGDGNGPVNLTAGSLTGPQTTFTTAGVLAVGTHNFTVEVTDTTGHTSAASSAAVLINPATLAVPSPATGLTATLNP